MDAVFLARLQFALTIGFHFIFPPITIGLAWLLVIVEYRGWKKDDDAWRRMGMFFGKLLALTFAVGVATGIVMEFQFGTNWASYSKFVGDIFGAPLAAEGVFAFFLESSFLGLYLFGRGRVSKGIHWFAILMVAVGATISAFWILVANSWQQTPAGFIVNEELGRAELTSFAEAVFNPSTLIRFFHTIVAALVTGAFFMAGVAAWMVRKGQAPEVAKPALKLSLVFGLVAAVLSAFPTGHIHAGQVAKTQPEKFAAMEGLYTSADGTPLVVFALPDVTERALDARIEIPNMLAWMAFGDPDAHVASLEEFPEDQVPQGAELWITFVSFHNMVLIGGYMVFACALGLFLLWRKKLWDSKWYLWMMSLSIPLPIAACQFGWAAAEVGRQPWIVYKLLRTSEAASVTVSAGEILTSIIMFGLVYLVLGALWFTLMVRAVNRGPRPATPTGEAV